MNSHAIEITDLVFRYEDHGFELNVPNLTIRKGEQVAVVGASGCGKTTLAYLIAGIYVPAAGQISVDGHTVAAMSDVARRDFRISNIGLIFQEFELLEYLRVEENIVLPYFVNASLVYDKPVRERARALADSVGIGDKLGRYAGELSQGEKQRLAVCRALITDPALVMADEPTGNLDTGNTDTTLRLLHRQVCERGATFVMITHERGLLDQFDRVIDLEAQREEAAS